MPVARWIEVSLPPRLLNEPDSATSVSLSRIIAVAMRRLGKVLYYSKMGIGAQ